MDRDSEADLRELRMAERTPAVRAMILAAGLGTRLRPLTELRAKPALPVCGRPVISLLLELLSRHGVAETLINLHYLPKSIRQAVESDHPEDMKITWSEEPTPLGTGGGIRRAADFLRGSDDCLVLAGDMLLDIDLTHLLSLHRSSGRDVTLVLRSDARGEDFGTIGLNAAGDVTRIGKRLLSGAPTSQTSQPPASPLSPNSHPPEDSKESQKGLFTGVRFFSRNALTAWPDPETFEDLRDWLAPRIESGETRVGAEIVESAASVWEPVGTPMEYLEVNLSPPSLPSLGGAASSWQGDLQPLPISEPDSPRASVISASAIIPSDAKIESCVVWENERIPAGFTGRHGVYAGDAFHPCGATAAWTSGADATESLQ